MRFTLVLSALVLAGAAVAAEAPDPLNSTLWPDIRPQVLGDGPVVFDPRVVVTVPANAEDSTAVPVAVRVEGIDGVRAIVLFADYNPIPKILTFHPLAAEPFVATRFKINMATPVRAAALGPDGVWHVGGAWVDAAGGGCSAPSIASADPAWQSRLGETHARAWPLAGNASRLRIRLLHPMDTGLVGNIPAFYLEHLQIAEGGGRPLARIETFEPVAENPVLTIEVKARPGLDGLVMTGRDNSGNQFAARIREGAPP